MTSGFNQAPEEIMRYLNNEKWKTQKETTSKKTATKCTLKQQSLKQQLVRTVLWLTMGRLHAKWKKVDDQLTSSIR